MLQKINKFFGNIGEIYMNEGNYDLVFSGLNKCLIVRDHFIKYPLLTYRLVYFTVWSQVLDIMQAGGHFFAPFPWSAIATEEGLLRIVALRAFMKKGINEDLQQAFPVLPSVEAPLYNPQLETI
uniref:Homing endonuclease LAGLIDADG domain-containing protein n=1 Tax=Wolfiporia cocos TaxID=81056 RepID=A0A7G7YDT0_9APHY|nr:hypothetical protein [Wolfiporia cocos]QNH92650.1 hypothetical protein [Wolfiporia cocos]